MNKVLLTVIGLGFALGMNAQEAADKKFQMGLALGAGMNFTKPQTKLIDRKGLGGDFTIGMNLNWNFNKNVGLATGLEFDLESFKYHMSGTSGLYYGYSDTEILRKKDDVPTDANLFLVTDRKQKPIYLSIPTMFLFRTDMIGYFRYFGKFGVRHSILLSQSVDDKGFMFDDGTLAFIPAENEKMKAAGDMPRYKGAVGLSGGAEWNFTGSTSLVAEIGYYYGFTNMHSQNALTGDDDKNKTLFEMDPSVSGPVYRALSAKQGQLMLKVSILF